ncbi:hypothetical protein BGZ96_009126 [Linnemannia gamsii]|uniref:Uncharacterized protein n=1 Tax=Linnemannia gamsii TaxID=64522 RepID=A0ABQ7KDZ7_9FUNG|nr:hypothetical protein BGZ96_009126 [Linnemannia gamsii]
MATPHQRFRQGEKVVSIAVRKDRVTGETYSRITDVLKFFPNASLFNVNGIFLHYLEDENEQEYEPKRIAHYPDDVLSVVVNGPPYISTNPSAGLFGEDMALPVSRNTCHLTPMLSNKPLDLPITNLSLRLFSVHTSSLARSSTYSSASSPSSSLSSSNTFAQQSVSIARPMAALSATASDITHIQRQLDHSVDQQSVHHQQLLERLVQLLERP